MFTLNEAAQLAREKALIIKQTNEDNEKSKDGHKPPAFNPIYEKCLRLKGRIMAHSDEEYFPDGLYRRRAPNQTDDEFEYVKANHKAITYPVWDRFRSSVNRIWNDANWSVSSWGEVDPKYEAMEGAAPQAYFEKDYPLFGSLEYYFKTIVTEEKERDPNAVLAHKPYEIPIKSDETGAPVFTEDGGVIVDDAQMVEPVAVVFGCENVIDFRDGEFLLALLDEKSKVTVGKNTEPTGLIFELYDENNIYRIEQYGEKKDYNFKASVFWPHNLGYLPCQKLKGRPEFIKSNLIYKSHFLPACEPLDLALLDNSYLLISKYRHAFPQKWEFISPCEFNHPDFGVCDKGSMTTEKGHKFSCPSCKGTGVQKSTSPFQTIHINMPDVFNGATSNIPTPPAGYINPDIATPEFLRKEIDGYINAGASILNISFSNSEVKGGDTALGKQIDRESEFSFLMDVSYQIFDLYGFSAKCIQQMRYGTTAKPPEFNAPKNFGIRNEIELTEEIAKAKETGLPDIVIRHLISEYLSTRFSNNEKANKVVNLVFTVDRLATLSSLEIAQKNTSGSIAKWEDILHTSIYSFVDSLIESEPDFLEQDPEVQKQKLIDLAKAKEKEIAPKKVDTNQILANAGTDGDS